MQYQQHEALGARPHRYFTQIGSTNDEAKRWALAGGPPGAVVLAEEQTAGRGRHGRAWTAVPGSSILLSVILQPKLPPDLVPRVNLMGAVALAETLTAFGLMPRIKWPNDVLLGGRKTAGILAEAVWHGDHLAAVILGCGINVYRHALPEDMAAHILATSVEAALGSSPDRWLLLLGLLARIDYWMPLLAFPDLLDAWRVFDQTLGRPVTAVSGPVMIAGTAESLDESGALLLRTADGTLHRLTAGEVTLKQTQDR